MPTTHAGHVDGLHTLPEDDPEEEPLLDDPPLDDEDDPLPLDELLDPLDDPPPSLFSKPLSLASSDAEPASAPPLDELDDDPLDDPPELALPPVASGLGASAEAPSVPFPPIVQSLSSAGQPASMTGSANTTPATDDARLIGSRRSWGWQVSRCRSASSTAMQGDARRGRAAAANRRAVRREASQRARPVRARVGQDHKAAVAAASVAAAAVAAVVDSSDTGCCRQRRCRRPIVGAQSTIGTTPIRAVAAAVAPWLAVRGRAWAVTAPSAETTAATGIGTSGATRNAAAALAVLPVAARQAAAARRGVVTRGAALSLFLLCQGCSLTCRLPLQSSRFRRRRRRRRRHHLPRQHRRQDSVPGRG